MFIGILASSGSKEVKVDENSILFLDLNSPITERAPTDPLDEIFSELTGQPAPTGLNQILANIKKAKNDSNIKGIYIESGLMSAGYATIEEIRNALLDFRNSGKFVYSFAPIYSQKSYYLASAGDKVFLNPAGILEFKGLSSVRTFYKGTLDKLGIEMQVFKHGEFKSAVEPFILESMSDAARLQTQTYINSMWGHVVQKIAESRNLTVEGLNHTAGLMPMFREDSLLITSGLIDGFKYKDEVIDILKELTGTSQEDDLNAVSLRKYSQVYVSSGKKKGLEKNKIAVIYADGTIVDSSSEDGGIKADKLSKTIREARRDSSIKAIVLRVNSPGGSGLGSEIIWREVKLARETKPVVVSMGDLAASGGYYISCAADTIVAHNTTLTGSIGVFGLVPNTKGLLKKIGITTDRVKTHTYSDMPSLDRPFTADEKQLMQAYVDRFYDKFLQRCADGRNTTKDIIGKVGEGRVWSGENALGIKLVDKIGGIDDAVAIAARMANIETYRIEELPEMLSSFEQILRDLTGEAAAKIGMMMIGEDYKLLKTINGLKTAYPVQARVPYEIIVH